MVGINFQTMVCHGLMVVIGIFLLVKYIPLKHISILYATGVFGANVIAAILLNEAAFHSGIIGDETFNMFLISYHFDCSIPVLSEIYKSAPYPIFLASYIFAFSLVSYVILLAAMGISALSRSTKARKVEKGIKV